MVLVSLLVFCFASLFCYYYDLFIYFVSICRLSHYGVLTEPGKQAKADRYYLFTRNKRNDSVLWVWQIWQWSYQKLIAITFPWVIFLELLYSHSSKWLEDFARVQKLKWSNQIALWRFRARTLSSLMCSDTFVLTDGSNTLQKQYTFELKYSSCVKEVTTPIQNLFRQAVEKWGLNYRQNK